MMSATNWLLSPRSGMSCASMSGVTAASPLTIVMVAGTVFAPSSRVGVRIVMMASVSRRVDGDLQRALQRRDGVRTCHLVSVLPAVATGELDDLLGGVATGVHA